MKNPILASALLALLGGATAAGVAVSLLVPAQDGGPAAAAVPGAGDIDDMRSEMTRLRNENAELARRLDDLENRPMVPPPSRQEVAAADTLLDDEQLRDELQRMVASFQDPSAPVDANFQAKVDAALRSIREQEDLEREQRQEQAAEERLEQQLTRLTEKLGLDSYQVAGLRDVALNASDRRDELVARAREADDFGGMREAFRDMRKETDDAVRNLLSPDQYEQYEDSDMRIGSSGRDFRGGGFGRGGGNGGDRGGRRGD